jgi:hypothetical protein
MARQVDNPHRISKPLTREQAFIWFLVLFYISLAVFVVLVTPKRIAQYLHDKAQLIAQHPLGWLLLGGLIGSLYSGME